MKYQLTHHELDAGTIFSAYAETLKADPGRPEPGLVTQPNYYV
jgi:hypothetical protein